MQIEKDIPETESYDTLSKDSVIGRMKRFGYPRHEVEEVYDAIKRRDRATIVTHCRCADNPDMICPICRFLRIADYYHEHKKLPNLMEGDKT